MPQRIFNGANIAQVIVRVCRSEPRIIGIAPMFDARSIATKSKRGPMASVVMLGRAAGGLKWVVIGDIVVIFILRLGTRSGLAFASVICAVINVLLSNFAYDVQC